MLNRLLIKVISFSLFFWPLGCKEKDFTSPNSNIDKTNKTDISTIGTTTKNLKSLEKTYNEFSSLFIPLDERLVINKKAFENPIWKNIPSHIAKDWIHVASPDIEKEINFNNWIALAKGSENSKSFFCMANIDSNDIRLYLLKYDNNIGPSLAYLGSIFEYQYIEANEEVGEKYKFTVSECENLHLEFIGDSLYTRCDRYSTTIGKDWRVDQNLYVNDTVKLPSINKSYSLY